MLKATKGNATENNIVTFSDLSHTCKMKSNKPYFHLETFQMPVTSFLHCSLLFSSVGVYEETLGS